MPQEHASTLLQQLGYSAYESKTYLGLLSCQPATAYEIAKNAKVPTSKIYEVLGKLVAKGVVQPREPTEKNTQQYVALDPKDFSQQLKANTISRANELLPLLESFSTESGNDYIWPLSSLDQVVSKSAEMIEQSTQTILVSCWAEELVWMKDALLRAESRGVKIAFVHFGKTAEKIGATYYHPIENTLYQEKGGRGLTLVTDNNVVLICNLKPNGALDATWSKNSAFVTVAEDYVKHDVYITKVTRFLPEEMQKRFGVEYEQLRDIFNPEA